VTDGTTIYATAMNGNVAAFNADGSTRWQRKVADGAIAGTPALKDGILYVGSYDRHLYAVDAANGETRWRSSSADNWFWTEPVIDGDTIFAGNMDGSVYALDLSNGTQRWKAKVGAPVRGRAAVTGGVVLVPARNGWLWGLQSQSGEKAWEPVQVGGNLYADLAVTPSGILLASEVGKSSHKLYTVDATGRVTQIAL
jgi:outer membrane protein assembly factor BamB